MPYATRDGLRLYYEHTGAGAPAFVFVPGWCCDHTLFAPLAAHFAATSSVTTYDLRGCGASDDAGDYELASLADELAWLCAEVGAERPVLVGHSLGALIALELAVRHPHVPGAIVAVDPGPIDPLPESRVLLSELRDRVADPEEDDPRPGYVAGMFRPNDDPERAQRVVATMCSPTREVAAAQIEGYLRWDGVAALRACDAPLLVVLAQPQGSNAPGRLLALKPDVRIGVTVGAGHFLQLDAADQLAPMIERFVRDVL